MVGIGNIFSLGGGSGGGSNTSGSGIISVNSETGPDILLVGANGIEVSVVATNTILIDGAPLSGLIGSGSSSDACYTATFTGILSQTFNHNLGTKSIVVQVADSNEEAILADAIIATSDNDVFIRFNTPTTGRITVLSCGGSSGSSASGVQKYAASFLNITSGIFTHNLNTLDVIVQVRDNPSGGGRVYMPDEIVIDNLNNISLVMNNPQSGRIVIIG